MQQSRVYALKVVDATYSCDFLRVTRQFRGDRVVLDEAIGFWLHRAYQSMRNASFRGFREAVGYEVTPEQWIVLVRLWEEDGQRQVDLGDGTFRDRPTMSRILDG